MQIDIEKVWKNCKDIIEKEISQISFNTRIEKLYIKDYKDNIVYLYAANEFIQGIVEKRYKDLIKQAFKINGLRLDDLIIVADSKSNVVNLNTRIENNETLLEKLYNVLVDINNNLNNIKKKL